jgi:hypothetical protein
MHDLAAGLPEFSKVDQREIHPDPGFLGKFTLGRLQGILPFLVFAFRYGPCGPVFLCPERSAGVDEENFQIPFA